MIHTMPKCTRIIYNVSKYRGQSAPESMDGLSGASIVMEKVSSKIALTKTANEKEYLKDLVPVAQNTAPYNPPKSDGLVGCASGQRSIQEGRGGGTTLQSKAAV